MIENTIVDWLKANDIPFFLKRAKMSVARDAFGIASGIKASVSEFRAAVNNNCRYWKTSLRKRVRETVTLDDDGWVKLKREVRSILEDLRGRSLSDAVELVRTRVSVNASLLEGLTSDCHVWSANGM